MPINLLDATAPAEPAPDPASGPVNLLDATAPSGGGAPVAAQPVVIPDTDVDHPDTIARYPDGTPILDHTGNPMQKPPFADLGLAIQRGQDLAGAPFLTQLLTLRKWHHAGGDMDYQRPPGRENDPIGAYQDFSNYIFGAVPEAAGMPDDIAGAAGIVNNAWSGRWRSGFLGTPYRNLQMRDLGRSDYLNNRLSYTGVQPAGPPMVYPPPTNQTPTEVVPFPGLFPLGPPTIYPPQSNVPDLDH
jgi:hypothetical protein